MQLSIQIKDAQGNLRADGEGEDCVSLVYPDEYAPGDRIVLSARPGGFLVIQLDDAMEPAYVCLKGGSCELTVPFDEKRIAYSPRVFSGERHLLRARAATPAEIAARKNLAVNPYDSHENGGCFPHAFANVETRGESVFAARNAIDGNTENHCHGAWPYESWGINKDPHAELTVDFGRPVRVDEVVLVTRADFPHDNWWKQAKLTFSDGSTETLTMQKSDRPHAFALTPRVVTRLTLSELIADADNPSPFPALSQIEVYGTEADA